MSKWGSPEEHERSLRIHVSVWAYAYEIKDAPLVDDYTFDRFAFQINKTQGTGHPLLDEFFLFRFSPITGMWIHQHPELDRVGETYERYYQRVLAPTT